MSDRMRRALALSTAITALVSLGAPCHAAPDADKDRDGLSDIQEVHKYFTDPAKKDSDGDGTPDGEGDERREYTYSVRTRIRVLRPVADIEFLNDDYQDATMLKSTDDYVELEVTHYPLNTWADAIGEDPKWRTKARRMKEFTSPSTTANWDSKLRKQLLEELAARGLDNPKASDRELAEGVSKWLMERSKRREMFCTYYIDFAGKRPRVLKGTESAFQRGKGDSAWTDEEQMENELFGRSMFANRTRGACTSSSIYLTTGLRAMGLPTRSIIIVPVADASDPAQRKLVADGLTHHRVRSTVLRSMDKLDNAFASHTFNEVFVDGRWRRLNYAKLGQNILDVNYMGLMTHVHTFGDIADADLARTWGLRYATGRRRDEFPSSNPYRALEISDLFGEHAAIDNPEVPEPEPLKVTATSWWQDRREELPSSWMDPSDGQGYLILSLADSELRHAELRSAKTSFVLRAEGRPDVKAKYSGNLWGGGADVLVLIDRVAFASMQFGLDYTIVVVDSDSGPTWQIPDDLTIRRPNER